MSRWSGAPVAADWTWRAATALYFVFTILRGSTHLDASTTILQFGQFIPILLGGLLLALFSRPRRPSRPAMILLASIGAYLLVALASIAVSVDPSTSFAHWLVSTLMALFIGWTCLARWVGRGEVVRRDLAWLALLATGAQVVGLVILGLFSAYATGATALRFVGVFNNANSAGIVSSLAIVILAWLITGGGLGRVRWLFIGSLLPLTAALYLSGSRTALIGCALGVGFVVLGKVRARGPRITVAAATLAVVAVVALVPIASVRGEDTLPSATVDPSTNDTPDPLDDVNDQTSGRLDLYLRAIDAWRDAPVLGHGFRTTPLVLDGQESHNLVLGILVETGLVGLLPLAGGIAGFVLLLRSRRFDRSLIGPAVTVGVSEAAASAFFGWGGPITLLLWAVIAALFTVERDGP